MGKQFCADEAFGKGRLWLCLAKNKQQLTNKKCRAFVRRHQKAQKEDVTINPLIRQNCKQEQTTFCKGIEHGKARVLNCLTSNMNETRFSPECKSSLIAIGMNFKTVEKKVGAKEIMKL